MIQKLRRRFVLISVTVLSAVMILLTVVINAANWISVRQDIGDTADELASSAVGYSWNKGHNRQNRHGEAIYESRYFVVTEEKSGLTAELSNVSSYTEEDAVAMAEAVLSGGKESGFINECFYRLYSENSRSAVLFLDCGSRLTAVRQLMGISLVTCCGGILAAWLLMSLFSKRAIRPILESTEKQKRFITDASHELKTPLSVIQANMDVMAMDDPDNEWILSTRRQTGMMSRMVNDLVFLTRMDEEASRPAQVKLDLAQLFRDTAEPFAMMAEAGGRVFKTETPESLMISGDQKGLERLISVLCDNALKYSPEGDTILLRLAAHGGWVTIESENTPADPIPPEKLKHLFDRFYRADEARSKRDGKNGFGIGLAIAQAVAEAHDGDARAWMQGDRLRIQCRLRKKAGAM